MTGRLVLLADVQVGGLKLYEWTLTKDEKSGVDIAGADKYGVKFCESATLSITYWAESN